MRPRLLGAVNPLVLLAVGLLAVVASAGVRTLPAALLAVAVILVLSVALVPGVSRSRWRYAGPALAAASVVFSTWLLGGHDGELAGTAGLRILVLALPGAVLAPLIDPSTLGDYLTQRLRLPPRPVAAAIASLQRFEQLGSIWSELAVSRRARGHGATRSPMSRLRALGPLTFGLLVAALRDANRISVAMDARGFATAHRRTHAQPAPWTRLDSGVLTVAAVLALLPHLL